MIISKILPFSEGKYFPTYSNNRTIVTLNNKTKVTGYFDQNDQYYNLKKKGKFLFFNFDSKTHIELKATEINKIELITVSV